MAHLADTRLRPSSTHMTISTPSPLISTHPNHLCTTKHTSFGNRRTSDSRLLSGMLMQPWTSRVWRLFAQCFWRLSRLLLLTFTFPCRLRSPSRGHPAASAVTPASVSVTHHDRLTDSRAWQEASACSGKCES